MAWKMTPWLVVLDNVDVVVSRRVWWHSWRMRRTVSGGRLVKPFSSRTAVFSLTSCSLVLNCCLMLCLMSVMAESVRTETLPVSASCNRDSALNKPSLNALRMFRISSIPLAWSSSGSIRTHMLTSTRYRNTRPYCTVAAHMLSTASDGKTSAKTVMSHCVVRTERSKPIGFMCAVRVGRVFVSIQSNSCMSTIVPARVPK
mmetsp:Transcript_55297/g.98415  ORF Transcript_55297/g.98415 Transcript_55297/m.98415 type:complete len:201 (+) Transcript_55297:2133-2735(+)